MFIARGAKDYSGYHRRGRQVSSGLFLILWSKGHGETRDLRAAVRHVRMSQCGHWMMGSARIGPVRVTLSGAYGADGLTNDPDRDGVLWDRLVPVPAELAEAWATGEGWNSAGREGLAMRDWARANLRALRAAGKV